MIVERKKLMILPRVGAEVRRAGDHRFPQYPDDWRDGRRRGGGRVQGIPDSWHYLFSCYAPLCSGVRHQCTVKHHTDIINFACMTWNFVRISASLSALCTNINQICHWHCISCKILPQFDVRTISVAQKL